MFSQDENSVSDASNTRRILTPISDVSLAGSDGLGSQGRKRKHDGSTMDDLLKDTFIVKPYPSTGVVKPRSLQPLLLLPRSQLPLSALDIASSSNPLSNSRLFETHVKILELEGRMGSQPMVLIARLDDGRTLYAVEREDRGLYVLCQLGSWINIKQLQSVSVASVHDVSAISSGKKLGALGLRPDFGLAPSIAVESSKFSSKKRLAIEAIQSMVKRPSTGLLTDSQAPSSDQEPIPEAQPEQAVLNAQVDDLITQPTSNEIFETIRNQYFEALYLSKASLAYFAKGPLSRARAAFHLDYDSTLDMNEYIVFLESMVISTTLIDKKYKDGVPECVSTIDLHDQSADDAAGKIKKRKTNKKMKPGKTGLYPLEDGLIRKWWESHDDEIESGVPGSSKDEVTRSRISGLKIRETQLQMIVMLEVLALRPLASNSEELDEALPADLPQSQATGKKEKTPRQKKPDHLIGLIDVHIDRLCIWQSIELEAGQAPINSESQSKDALGAAGPSKHADNILRDFCIDIIVPFFSARLPDRCTAISRKLGVPVGVSPPKPQISKSSSFSGSHSRSGAVTKSKRPVVAKPKRTLQRIRTDERERRSESRGPNRAISLMRSATAPLLPTLKREGSEAPSLSSIPMAESQPLHANRGGVLNSKRFSQREVDMSSLAVDANTKAKKQATIDAELKEAILALKKPNRELAGKTLAETAEQRSVSASHRKNKKPVRNPLFHGVQITATPKVNRRKNMATGSHNSKLPKMSEEMDAMISSSSIPRIPDSEARSSQQGLGRNPFFQTIQATPSRKPFFPSVGQSSGFLEVSALGNGNYLPSSPLQQRRSSVQLFNTVPDSAVKDTSIPLFSGLQETPIKKRKDDTQTQSDPIAFAVGNNKENGVGLPKEAGIEKDAENSQEVSIYKSLGWDDGDDFDDLT